MLLLLTVLTAVGSAVSLTVSDPGNILQSGGRTTIQWVTNSNTDPGDFNIELLSPTYNLVAVLAQHVGTVLYQYTIDLPPVPPSPAQQVWAKSRSFSIASNTTTAAPLLGPSTQTQPKGTTSAGHSETSIPTERFATSGSSAGQTSTTPGSATQMSLSSTSSSISKSINCPPTSFMSATSLMSAPATSPPSSHSAAQASTSRKSSAGASVAGIAAGIVSLLLMGGIIWFCIRRSRKNQQRQMALRPHVFIPKPPDDERGIRQIFPSCEKSRSLGVQESVEEQLRALRQQLATVIRNTGQGGGDLEEALRQNQTLQGHIRALELQIASESSDQSPPEYPG